ncbi:MAG: carbamoyl-phosphate synthase (glutamine-hydrolyzing) large subunit, partial [Candidatus Parcubacteria bacterium]
SRIKGADPLSYVEMASTGEVACFGDSYAEALLSAMLASGMRLPKKAIFVTLGGDEHKVKLLPSLEKLSAMGFKMYATEHTAAFLRTHNLECERVYKINEGGTPSAISIIEEKLVDLIINIPSQPLARDQADGFVIRRKAVDMNVPLITNRQLAEAFVSALEEIHQHGLGSKAWSEFLKQS